MILAFMDALVEIQKAAIDDRLWLSLPWIFLCCLLPKLKARIQLEFSDM